jgi:prevent-host-death family protein
MCYMAAKRSVGVRELRQNLSVYLRRVKRGVSLEVTERGQPVARLMPLVEQMSERDRLVAEGKLIAGGGRLAKLGPPEPVPGVKSLSGALAEVREDTS